jgi:hypothetical protein
MTVDATLLELGPANVYLYEKPRAFLETVLAGTNNDLRLTAVKPGVAGNSITLTIVVAGNNTLLTVTVSGNAITVNSATDGTGLPTSTATQVRDAINAHPAASGLVTVTHKSGDTGAGVIAALASTPLAGGSDTGVATDIGFLGEGLQVVVGTESTPLTGAQTGNVAQNEVISGGSVLITVPFKEIKMENFRRAIPNSRLYTDGTKQRVAFAVRVGQKMRDLAVKMEIRKVVGGVEATDVNDILVIPEASPVAGEVTIPFSPTDQREITATFRAWPDAKGAWAYFGDNTI